MQRQQTRWITSRQLAEFAGLHPDTVSKWAREGRIPGHHVGAQWRFEYPAVLTALGGKGAPRTARDGAR